MASSSPANIHEFVMGELSTTGFNCPGVAFSGEQSGDVIERLVAKGTRNDLELFGKFVELKGAAMSVREHFLVFTDWLRSGGYDNGGICHFQNVKDICTAMFLWGQRREDPPVHPRGSKFFQFATFADLAL